MNTLIGSTIGWVLAIVVSAIVSVCAFYTTYYEFTFVGVCFIVFFTYRLIKFHEKVIRQFTLFTNSIQFSESKITFHSNISDPLFVAYYNSLEVALEKVNIKNQKREVEISFYDMLLNRIDFALLVADNEDNITWINKFALDLLGRPKPLNLNSLKKISGDLYNLLTTLDDKSEKTVKVNRKGKNRKMVVGMSVITVRGNRLRVYTLKDVQPVVDETEHVAWQQLISVLTHEIMNSLTPIISLSETLNQNDTNPDLLQSGLLLIQRRSKGLVEFVSNYKHLLKIEKPQKQPVVLKTLIEDVVLLMNAEGLNLIVFMSSENLILYADYVQLEQVIINLLKNAKEACEQVAYPVIKIEVLNNEHEQIIINIIDNGLGINLDIADKIFTPFYTTKPKGSGIGLSICRQIINNHGGTLSVSSDETGSVFSILL